MASVHIAANVLLRTGLTLLVVPVVLTSSNYAGIVLLQVLYFFGTRKTDYWVQWSLTSGSSIGTSTTVTVRGTINKITVHFQYYLLSVWQT
jgi:hypothetical protein